MNNMIEIKFFEVVSGSDITQVVKEAIELARKLSCKIIFNFNAIKLTVYYFSQLEEVVDEYYIRLKENE